MEGLLMNLLSLLSEEEKEKYVRLYGEKQTITYQGLYHIAVNLVPVKKIIIDVLTPPTLDKSGMYYCICRAILENENLCISELGAAKKADPVAAVEAASFLAKVNILRAHLNTDMECFEVVAKSNPPQPVTAVGSNLVATPFVATSVSSKVKEARKQEGPDESTSRDSNGQVWNKKDTVELATYRKLMGFSQNDLIPYIKDWSRGLSNSLRAITQENIKAFNKYVRRRVLEKFSEEKINRALEEAWKEAGCWEE
jgi:hypothetical protein